MRFLSVADVYVMSFMSPSPIPLPYIDFRYGSHTHNLFSNVADVEEGGDEDMRCDG